MRSCSEVSHKDRAKKSCFSDDPKMDFHAEVLKSLCRLCGDRAKPGGLTPKWKLKREVESALQVSFNNDSHNHPQGVCNCCRLKLSRWRQQKAKKPINIVVKIFTEHSPENCTICTSEWMPERVISFCQSKGLFSWKTKTENVVAVKLDDLGRVVLKRVEFSKNNSVQVEVLGIALKATLPLDIGSAVEQISQARICIGNPSFQEIAESSTQTGLRNNEGKLLASVYSYYYSDGEVIKDKTIRHSDCLLLLTEGQERAQCDVCYQYKCTLSAMQSRKKRSASTEPSKFTANKYLSKEQLAKKASSLAAEKTSLKQQLRAMEKRIDHLLEMECIKVPPQQSDIIQSILQESQGNLLEHLPEGSYSRLLWEQQIKALSTTSRQMRWHPDLLRWAIAIHAKSPSAYRTIRDSGFLRLPHPNTLFSYTHFVQPRTDIVPDLLARFYNDWDMGNLKEHERNINLVFDEMKIKSGLCFSRSSGQLIGFVDIGNLTHEIGLFEKRCQNATADVRLASHVLLFMVRGVTSKMKFPLAYFATENVTGSDLYPMVRKCIKALKLIGLKTLALTSDGASCNRTLYSIFKCSSEVHKGLNPFEKSHGDIFFICDVPHLIKTSRNNMENSNWHNKTRKLVFDGKPISWTHLLELQEWDQGRQRATPGLQLVPKLTFEHLHLTPGLRMKVNLAAQVLSGTVAHALEVMKKPHLSSTILFIKMMNRFFDCLNVRRRHEWQRRNNPDLKPYTSPEDPRLKWLKEEFLVFLDKWENEAKSANIPKKEQNKLCLSHPTLTGLRITVHSFLEIVPLLLEMEGVEYFLSGKLNQDTVEEFFAKQRAAGGSQDNPTVDQFGNFMLQNYVAGSSSISSMRANVSAVESPEKAKPLPRRKRKSDKLFE